MPYLLHCRSDGVRLPAVRLIGVLVRYGEREAFALVEQVSTDKRIKVCRWAISLVIHNHIISRCR
jgi:hypothetical protein